MTICLPVGGNPRPMPVDQTNKPGETGIDILKKKIETVGKLKFIQDVPVKYLDKTRLIKYMTAIFTEAYPEALGEKEGIMLRMMGFSARDAAIQPRATRKRLLSSNVNGVYDEKAKELLALNQYRDVDFMNAMILAHEFRHALQDQHFNLSGMLAARPPSDFDDRRLALMAAIEGDATFLMVQTSKLDAEILTSTPTADALMSFLPIAKPSLMHREPAIIKYQLLMPYMNGLQFINAIFKKKKWKGVNSILQHPPESSEQILHPEKYLDREEPVQVLIQYQPEGYHLVHAAVIGEYYLNILLTQDDYSYRDYALGWGGDIVHIYNKDTSYFLAWESQWDKELFCANFFADFKRFIEKRYNVDFKKGRIMNKDFVAGKSAAGENYFFLMKEKTKIFYARADNRDQMNSFIYGGNYD